jgi:hypothetical protein
VVEINKARVKCRWFNNLVVEINKARVRHADLTMEYWMTSWCRFKELIHCIKDYENWNEIWFKHLVWIKFMTDKIET